jgi:heterodisulfide reductase subunit A
MAKRIGVYVCECGANISEKVDVDRVVAAVSHLKDVAVAEKFKLLCSGEGKEFLKQSIEEHGLTHVVVAACSPKQHEITFMNVLEGAGLNPYLFQMANIREQCAWITPDKEEATEKAIRHVKAAINRVHYNEPLERKEMECSPDVLVIGGGIAGIRASKLLATPDRKVYLVEKKSSLGGKVKEFDKLFLNMDSASDMITREITGLLEKENIEVLTDSEVEQILGFLGSFDVKVKKKAEGEEAEGREIEFRVGAVVLATGFDLQDPGGLPQYGYGKFDDVYTSLDFERMSAAGEVSLKSGKPPQSVAIIHCVGREEKGYCSNVCCLYSIKFARQLKTKLPQAKVSQFYSDLSIPGKSYQKFYEETRGMGVDFIRAKSTEVAQDGKGMTIKYETEAGTKSNLSVDMVILSPAMEPASDAHKLVEMLNIPPGKAGFFAEEHEKLAPVSTPVEGVFSVGCAQGPKNIRDSIAQAEAAAGRILSALVSGRKLELEVKTSTISEIFCTGCKTCIDVCPYGAIGFDEARRISVVNEVLCHGCGNCAAACPSGAAVLKHFTFPQIYHEFVGTMK